MYKFSDAWFLTTLILINDWASLQQVIAGGDLINHAIFTTEEINTALSAFTAFGYVAINEDKQMRVTEKAYSLCDKTFLRSGLFSKTERIFKKLKRTSYFDPIEKNEYFSESETHQAYIQYIKILRK